MCVLIAWLNQIPGHPLVVASNRDERLSRPASPPFIWPVDKGSGHRLLAPRDEEAGGTWWAVSSSGLFVATTNRAGKPPEPNRRSRGLLVRDMALLSDVKEARKALNSLKPADYNGFHLFIADLKEGLLAVNDGHTLQIHDLEPGMHVVSERSFGAMEPSRDREVEAVFRALPTEKLALDERIQALGIHRDDPWMSVCIHPELPDYGTRSSSLLALSSSASDSVLLNAEGPPCVTPFEDQSELLVELAVSSS